MCCELPQLPWIWTGNAYMYATELVCILFVQMKANSDSLVFFDFDFELYIILLGHLCFHGGCTILFSVSFWISPWTLSNANFKNYNPIQLDKWPPNGLFVHVSNLSCTDLDPLRRASRIRKKKRLSGSNICDQSNLFFVPTNHFVLMFEY